MDYLINLVIGGLFTGIIIYIVKGFFLMHGKNVDKVEHNANVKFEVISTKIEKINENHTHVYNNLLEKFSNWEDRIKKIVTEPNPVNKDKLESSFKFEILDTVTELEISFRQEMLKINYEIEEIQDLVKYCKSTIEEYKASNNPNSNRQYLNKMEELSRNLILLDSKLNEKTDLIESKLLKMFQATKTVVADIKILEAKFEELREATRTKIKFNP